VIIVRQKKSNFLELRKKQKAELEIFQKKIFFFKILEFSFTTAKKVQVLIENCPANLGELYDRYATNRVNFEPIVPQNPVTISFGIQNETHIALPFQFRLMKPDLVAFSQLDGAKEMEEFIYRQEQSFENMSV